MLSNLTSFLFAWYNLPFTVMLIACIVLASFQLMGLGGDHDSEGEAGVDHDADFGHDADLSHDADLDHDADLEHDADVDHDIDHDVDHDVDHEVSHDAGSDGGTSALNVLAFIGLGKAPLLVVLLILLGSIGLLGWMLNSVLTNTFGTYPSLAFAAVLPITVLAGTLISSRTARFIGRAIPPISTTATRMQALVGRRGTVISPFVDTKYGMVHLRDEGGTLLNIFAVIKDGEPIKRGSEVALVAYDPVKKVYAVTSV
jgi:membrane protein implicated in regulation of membrane protease activity